MAFIALSSLHSQGQGSSPCIAGVKADKSVYGYQKRGGVCEGSIQEQVAGDHIALRSFTESIGYSPQEKKPLWVRWTAPDLKGAVRIEGHDVQGPVRYRMDSAPLETKYKELEWQVDTLRELSIAKNQLGVVTYWEGTYLGGPQRIYLPAVVSQLPPVAAQKYEIVASINRAVSSVNVSIESIPKGPKPIWGETAFDVKENVARIAFERPAVAGIYELMIKGTVKSTKERVVKSVLFYECTGRAPKAQPAPTPAQPPSPKPT